MCRRSWIAPILLIGLLGYAAAQSPAADTEPAVYVFASPGGTDLKAYVFRPKAQDPGGKRAGIVIFHGGGWSEGEPSWAFGRASHFAERGLVAVAAQYRLSDGKTITPLDAMADARAVIRWMRTQSATLGLDPSRIVADGWSAGAHLAASTAIFDDPPAGANRTSAAPNVLVLVSPAVALESDGWAQRLLGPKTSISDVSPDAHDLHPSNGDSAARRRVPSLSFHLEDREGGKKGDTGLCGLAPDRGADHCNKVVGKENAARRNSRSAPSGSRLAVIQESLLRS